ncbi:uncharacterized protein [Amphiura filiformis]|uniref:uncharacterized protein n=1 Tax=Amphiura filiformis TaxID=82378 RepID=UPI003B21E3EE
MRNGNYSTNISPTHPNVKERWVKNLSDRSISDSECSLLEKGLNYAVSSKRIEGRQITEIITSTESAIRSSKLEYSRAEELRQRVNASILSAKPPKSNLTKSEYLAVDSLKKDDSITILPADKGRCTVVLNSKDYDQKVKTLLEDTKTYTPLKRDPTGPCKSKVTAKLKELHEDGAIDVKLKLQLNPTAETIPTFYGLPKVHKANVPLRPIVSSIGAVTYDIAKFLAKILGPLVGKSEHHILNSKDFADKISDLSLEPDETITSFDVTALFTTMAVNFTNNRMVAVWVHQFLRSFPTFIWRTLNAVALSTFDGIGPSKWYRYVDDTWVLIKACELDRFFNHINQVDPNIKFTQEGLSDNKLAFLDCLVHVAEGLSLSVSVYRKQTHTDQYLQFDSNHPLIQKLGVVKTLFHRAETIVTKESEKKAEQDHLRKALHHCGFKNWAIDKALNSGGKDGKEPTKHSNSNSGRTASATIPYHGDLSEKLKRIFREYNITTHFKPVNTIRQALVHPKDKQPKGRQSGLVYGHFHGELKQQLESIQRKAASNYRKTSSPTSMMAELEWDTLELRRKVDRLTLMHKITSGHWSGSHSGAN